MVYLKSFNEHNHELQFPMIIAYNMEEKKIGCALIQPMLGATITGGDVSFYFDTDRWELSPSKCKVYTIRNQEQFDSVVKLTNKK